MAKVKLMALVIHVMIGGCVWGQSTAPMESEITTPSISAPTDQNVGVPGIKVGEATNATSNDEQVPPAGMTKEYAIEAGLVADPNGPLHFPNGASTFLKEGGQQISATDLMRTDLILINEVLYNLDAYSVTKGVIQQADFDRLPQSSKDIVMLHKDLFIIQ